MMYFRYWFFAIWPFVMRAKALKIELNVNESIIRINIGFRA
jgi:hypothetical protein